MSVGLKRFGEKASSLQGALGSLGLMAALRGVIGTGIQFETAMNKVAAITGATGDSFRQLDALAQELGRTTQFTAMQAAEGMQFLAQAGLGANEILESMPGVLQLAAAGGLDLASAADIATNVVKGFALEGKELGRVNDVLALTAASANTNVFELGNALAKAAPLAATTGQQVEGMVAVLGEWANMGIKAEEAGTALKMALAKLINPAADARKALRRLRLSTKDLQDGEGGMLPLIDILELLMRRGAKAKDFLKIFGDRAGPRLAGFLKIGTGGMRELEQALLSAGGTAQTMAEIMMRELPGATLRFKSAMEGLTIALTKSVVPELTKFFNSLATLFQWLAELSPATRKFIMTTLILVTALTSLAVIGGILSMTLGSLFAVLAVVSFPIWSTVAAVVALIGVFTSWTASGNPVITMIGGILSEVGDLILAIGQLFGIATATGTAFDVISWSISKLGNVIALVLVPVKMLLQALTSTIRAARAILSLEFGKAWEALGQGGVDILATGAQGLDIGGQLLGITDTTGPVAEQRAENQRQQFEVSGSLELGLEEGLRGPERIQLDRGRSAGYLNDFVGGS